MTRRSLWCKIFCPFVADKCFLTYIFCDDKYMSIAKELFVRENIDNSVKDCTGIILIESRFLAAFLIASRLFNHATLIPIDLATLHEKEEAWNSTTLFIYIIQESKI